MKQCSLCKKYFEKVDNHHLDYEKDITIPLCRSCHLKVHKSDKYPHLKPIIESNHTTILINKETTNKLNKLKIHPRQSYEEVIVRLLENE